MNIRLDLIKPSPNPIRKTWDEDKLEELSQSIREQGLIVPIKVRFNPELPACPKHDYLAIRPSSEPPLGMDGMDVTDIETGYLDNIGFFECEACDRLDWVAIGGESLNDYGDGKEDTIIPYEVVYGHRRVEAARRAGLNEIEAIVEGVDDEGTLIQALIENVQREDMTDIDEGKAYKSLHDEHNLSIREIARKVGKGNTWVGRLVRLVDDPVSAHLGAHPDAAGKAEVLRYTLGNDESAREAVAEKSIKEGLTKEQILKVAESVAATKDPAMRQRLIDAPYSPYSHDPEYARERAERYGEHDPMARDKTPPPDEAWKLTVEVSMLLDFIKKSRQMYQEAVKMDEIGKFSPEARPFIARKLRQLVNDYERLIERLEN